MKNSQAGSESFHADGRAEGQTDRQIDRRDKVNSHFSQIYERA